VPRGGSTMDTARFDSLVRSLPMPCNRRGMLAALLGGTLGGLRLSGTAAKKKNKKNKKKKYPCPGGRTHLSNGTCAKVCTSGTVCHQLCQCNPSSVEGPSYCVADVVGGCQSIPQVCTTTADCPFGEVCLSTAPVCQGTNRCAPVCA